MMDLRQLEAFAAVVSVGSITGAAKMLDRSQPSVTRQIRELEEALGLLLFERHGPKVIPTQSAFSLAAEVEGVLGGIRQISSAAKRMVRAESQELRIAGTPALTAGLVPAALARIAGGHSALDIQMRSMAAEAAVQSVLTKTASVGVVSLPLEHRGIHVHWIGEAPCIAVVADTSPLAKERVLGVTTLATQTLITLSNPFRLRRRIDRVLRLDATTRILETNASLNAVQMARAGLGVALVDPAAAIGSAVEGVTTIPIAADIPFFFGAISAVGERPSQVTSALIDALEETAQTLLPGFIRHEANAHNTLLRRIHDGED